MLKIVVTRVKGSSAVSILEQEIPLSNEPIEAAKEFSVEGCLGVLILTYDPATGAMWCAVGEGPVLTEGIARPSVPCVRCTGSLFDEIPFTMEAALRPSLTVGIFLNVVGVSLDA